MAKINTYLNFDGNAEEAFNFYKSVWGGAYSEFQRFSDTSYGEKMSPEDGKKMMHIALPIGMDHMLMASDNVASMGKTLTVGNNFHLSIQAESKEEVDVLFAGLSEGGSVEMPLQDTFWGAYFCMFTDKFGIQWMINYDYPKEG